MLEMVKLRNELNAIGNNYNQVVKKLYFLKQLDEFKIWVSTNESITQTILKKVDEIKSKITQINDQWLQS